MLKQHYNGLFDNNEIVHIHAVFATGFELGISTHIGLHSLCDALSPFSLRVGCKLICLHNATEYRTCVEVTHILNESWSEKLSHWF